MKIILNNGKYEYVSENGNQAAYRHGEMWRDLTGDNFIYAMACEIIELERELNELAAQVERLRNAAMESQDWDWIAAKEAVDVAGDDFFEIDDMQRLWDLVRSETPPVALEAMKSQWQAEIISELKIHMMNNGYGDESDGVGAWFKERQAAHTEDTK